MATPFERVVNEYGPLVSRVVRATLNDADADEAWSETFLAALRAYPDLPSGTNIEAWLVTVAHRKAIDQHRARARRPIPTDQIPERPARTAEAGTTSLVRALAALPEKQRYAVAYHHLAGLPYAEIARLLGNNETAARRAAADGLRSLRRRLQEER